jgi:hypothetical protein
MDTMLETLTNVNGLLGCPRSMEGQSRCGVNPSRGSHRAARSRMACAGVNGPLSQRRASRVHTSEARRGNR